MELKNKVALITGGGSGLGLATAQALLAKGVKLAIFDLNTKVVYEALGHDNENLHCYAVDVSSATSVEKAMAAIEQQLGALHICINCAGIAPAKRVLNKTGEPMPLDNFAQAININLVGSFNVARCAAALMVKNETSDESGVIINTASVAAYEGQVGQCAYAASKGGIVSLTLPMARDLAKSGIRVNAIAPGIMGTPMLLAMPDNVQQSLVDKVQFPKRLGYPEEFARLVIHIAENAYVNAEVIRIDAGIRLPPS